MPTYQYACTNTDGKHEFEVVQSFTDDPVRDCPECGTAVRKVYGSVGVVFKGSGFYRTDSRNGSSSPSSSSSDSSSSSGSADSGGAKKEPATAASSSSGSASSSSGSASSSGGGAKAASAG